ncbi:MAG: ATP-binding protein [Gemmatimonadota bacterium]|nr:ATP-binding protein [Gemmatimonadota bacterium]
MLRLDGEYRHMRVHGVPVREPDGRIREWVGAEADVTEERREKERQRFLAEASAILSSSLDYRTTLRSVARLAVPSIADHCVVDVIEEGGKIVRVEVVFADGRRAPGYTSLSSPDWSSPQPAVRAMRSGTPVLAPEIDDAWLADHARSPEHLAALRQMGLRSLLAVPLVARGRTLGAITLSTGESGRHLGPQDLALAEEMAHRAALAIDNARLHDKAQRATRAREEILAVVSHELRGPLNVIDQGLEALIDLLPPEMWPSAGRRQLASMRGAANQSLVLVQDLLDITEIDAGHLKVRLRREEVASLVADALALMEPVAAAKSIRLEAHMPEGLPAVLVDRQRILQVLGNLVENAVRATPKGGVITASVAPAGTQVRFSVTDAGPGMTRQQLEHAFDRSWQVSGADRHSGLGLAIVRGIVKAHKGAIGAESRGERGSTCFFTLPAVDEAGASAPWHPDVEADDQTASVEVAIAPLRTRRGDEGGSKGQAERAQAEAADRSTRFRDTLSWERQDAADGKRSASEHLRYHILSALYLGNLRPGDRLPSVRQVTEDLGVPFRSVVQAYAALAVEGVVEKRDRSGIFVAEQEPRKGEALGETASWMANILMDAFTHQIRIPQLRRALHDWTAGLELRCACVDSIADRLVALSEDVTRYFGIDTSSVSADHLAAFGPKGSLDPDALPRAVREADFLLTTPFHATTLRQIAARLDKPLVIATVHPEISAAIRCQVQKGRVTMVCADRRFGEQLRGCLEGAYHERFRIVLAEDAAAVAELDPSEPVLLTRAAQQVLGTTDLRLLIPLSPSFSAATALHLSEILIQLNMNGLRR